MKHFAIATLLAASILVFADLSAEQTVPWHWDEEETLNSEEQQPAETNSQLKEDTEAQSDLGW